METSPYSLARYRKNRARGTVLTFSKNHLILRTVNNRVKPKSDIVLGCAMVPYHQREGDFVSSQCAKVDGNGIPFLFIDLNPFAQLDELTIAYFIVQLKFQTALLSTALTLNQSPELIARFNVDRGINALDITTTHCWAGSCNQSWVVLFTTIFANGVFLVNDITLTHLFPVTRARKFAVQITRPIGIAGRSGEVINRAFAIHNFNLAQKVPSLFGPPPNFTPLDLPSATQTYKHH